MKASVLAPAMCVLGLAVLSFAATPARAQCVPIPPVGNIAVQYNEDCYSARALPSSSSMGGALSAPVLAAYPLSLTAAAWFPHFAAHTPRLLWTPSIHVGPRTSVRASGPRTGGR